MTSFFTMAFIVSIFTVFAQFGVVKFETLQSENIGKENFQFFLYAYLFVTGILAASSYEERSWFRKFITGFTGLAKSVYLGFSGSLVGWSLGLLLYVLIAGEYGSVALGLVLSSYMILFAMAPAWYHEQIESERNRMVGFMFGNPRFGRTFNRLGWVFMLASIVGFYDFFSA